MTRQRTVLFISLLSLAAGLVFTVGPLAWMLITAFTDPENFASGPPKFDKFSLANFKTLLTSGKIITWTINSFLVSFAITFSQLLFNSLAAFGFSVGQFKGREILFLAVLSAIMVPGQILMLPLFLFMSKWGLIDSLWAVIIPGMSGPYGIYMIRQYMDSIPKELVAAARIDGASEFQLFQNIFLPLSQPILATLGIFVFITHWNAFLWPLVTLNSEAKYTLTVGLSTLQDQQVMDYGLLMAGATLAAIPMVLIFVVFSKYLLEGMRGGAIK